MLVSYVVVFFYQNRFTNECARENLALSSKGRKKFFFVRCRRTYPSNK